MPRTALTRRSERPPPGTHYPSGSVACMVCGRFFRALGGHLGTHGLTAIEYRMRFPGAATTTDDIREARRAGGRLGNEILRRQGGPKQRAVTYSKTA